MRRRLRYLAGELALYEQLTDREMRRDLARLRGGVDTAYIAQVADRFGLALDKRIRELSKGNKQKVGLIQAFMHRPEVLILDEPTSGLDPLLQRAFHELVGRVLPRDQGQQRADGKLRQPAAVRAGGVPPPVGAR